MSHKIKIVDSILATLDKKLYDYYVSEYRNWIEIHVDSGDSRDFIIRCNSSNSRVRIHNTIKLDRDVVINNRIRLLEACDIVNREMFLKARTFDDCIDIVYEIPEAAEPVIGEVCVEVLYEFWKNNENQLFDIAIQSIKDLYEYYNDKIKKENEEIKEHIRKLEP